MSRVLFIPEIYACPICGKPVCEAPRGSGVLACINYQCDYMTNFNHMVEEE